MTEHEIREVVQSAVRDSIEPMARQVGDMNRLLTGNGTPERGFVHKVLAIEGWMQRRQKMEWIVVTASIVAAVGFAGTAIAAIIRLT